MNTILIVLTAAAALLALERVRPNVQLKRADHWYVRALAFNGIQALIAFCGAYLWDVWFAKIPLFSLHGLQLGSQVVIGYLVITFIYYWWHRVRHSNSILWRFLHQFHHSAARIEVITSFYKHPLEVILNGMLSSAILYVLLGLSATAVGFCVLATGLAELVYHMNIKTPRLMGVFFQRPEMHRIHHQRGSHHYNFSDLPIWDMLFGTYSNPAEIDVETGFPDDNENEVWALLKGQELES